MLKDKVKNDIVLAQSICKALRSGNKESIEKLYYLYHRFFISFTRKLLYEMNKAEDVLSEFWTELLNAKAICAYEGKHNASLRGYLTKILKWRIIDKNRKKKIVTTPNLPPESENRTKKERQRRLINESLLTLGEISQRDADLVRMKYEGLTYKEMAEQELTDKASDRQAVERRTDAIKKQFTRPQTGSMARFSLILNRVMAGYGWEPADLRTY
ncbi:MAG: hypothetical protein DRI57_30095 [Deltaproteobacteria bacterium]|nr:MAG: hypothetical protein DRI57_30095 [Deltaproteobacteria bacterium]